MTGAPPHARCGRTPLQGGSFRDGARGVGIPHKLRRRATHANNHRRHLARRIQRLDRVICAKHGCILKRAGRASIRARALRFSLIQQLHRRPRTSGEKFNTTAVFGSLDATTHRARARGDEKKRKDRRAFSRRRRHRCRFQLS